MALSVLTYLEQHSPDEIIPAREQAVEVRRVEEVSPEFARYLYTAVGGHWHCTSAMTASTRSPGSG